MDFIRTLLLIIIFACTVCVAQNDQARDPATLVRQVVAVELQAQTHPQPRWMYRLEKTNASGTKLTAIAETPEGLVGRLLAINGRPLDPQTELNEQHRLQLLTHDPKQLKQKLARQERDRDRVLKIVRALPDAFLYTYERTDTETGEDVHLRFTPNPRYVPDSLEANLLKAMSGTLTIARQQLRLVHMEGTLISDVNIGLGIAGKIAKGGTLDLEQTQIAPGSWEIKHLVLKVRGRALFRRLDLSVEESASDFRPVPQDLTVPQAIDLLLHSSP